MSTDPELADAPDTPQDIAWEARHCADRLDSLAELLWEALPEGLDRARTNSSLRQAAMRVRRTAALIEGGRL